MHFTPTSAPWLNMVERFFAEITRKRIRRGVFHSIVELQMTINDYLDQHDANPTPFVWTASANSIIEKVKRGNQAFESLHLQRHDSCHSAGASRMLHQWVDNVCHRTLDVSEPGDGRRENAMGTSAMSSDSRAIR